MHSLSAAGAMTHASAELERTNQSMSLQNSSALSARLRLRHSVTIVLTTYALRAVHCSQMTKACDSVSLSERGSSPSCVYVERLELFGGGACAAAR